MTSSKYEKLIMITIIVSIIGILGFSEYFIGRKKSAKNTVTQSVSKVSDFVSYQNILVAKEAEHDLSSMIKSAGRDHIQILTVVGYQKTGTDEEKTGLLIQLENGENSEKQTVIDWLSSNAYKYGFIQYENGNYFMYRYVGRDIAKMIYEKNITFVEYLN